MNELSLRPRIHDLFVFGLFLEPEDVLRKKLEWAAEIGLERADRPGARVARTGRAVKCHGHRVVSGPPASPPRRRASPDKSARRDPVDCQRFLDEHARSLAALLSLTADRRARGTSSRSDEGSTRASSSSVMVERVTRCAGRREEIDEARFLGGPAIFSRTASRALS